MPVLTGECALGTHPRKLLISFNSLGGVPKNTKTITMDTTNPSTLTRTQWLICIIAVIGFAFDTYELLMLPLILRPALEQLGGVAFGSPEYARWRDLMFYVPAVCGGV